jgi:hypothetical protein
MSTGKTYEISGELTEWEDIMINKGIKTRDQIFIEKGLNPEDVSLILTENWLCHSILSPADFSLSVLSLKSERKRLSKTMRIWSWMLL